MTNAHRQLGKRGGWSGALLLGVCLSGSATTLAYEHRQDPGTLPEYVVKAGFLYNFAKYVEWPAEAFENADAPISIGIVGTDPFGEELDKALRNKTVKGRPFTITRFREGNDPKGCHILFIPKTEKARTLDLLKQAESRPTLTVGEDEGFAGSGGMISILIEKEKPRLEVNPEAAERAKLGINSKLLKLATIVRTAK